MSEISNLDNFYLSHAEPTRGCLIALRDVILSCDGEITPAWKYGMPFFCFRGRMFCYLWVHKKFKMPYLGLVEGARFSDADLLQEKRSRMKILLIDAKADLPIEKIKELIKKAIGFYRSGEIIAKK